MSHLAEAITIRNITFKNRIIKAAMSGLWQMMLVSRASCILIFMKPWAKVAWAVPLQEM